MIYLIKYFNSINNIISNYFYFLYKELLYKLNLFLLTRKNCNQYNDKENKNAY